VDICLSCRRYWSPVYFALKSREKLYRHAYATEVGPERPPGGCVVCLFQVNKGCKHPGRIVGLDGVGSVLPKDEHGLQSVPAWLETKCVSGILP